MRREIKQLPVHLNFGRHFARNEGMTRPPLSSSFMRHFLAIICLPGFIFASLLGAQASADGNFGELAGILVQRSKVEGRQPYRLVDGLADLKSNPAFAPLFVRYTLVKQSFSIQESSPLQPRVLMFGNTGRLIVTFNAAAHLGGGYALETAEYDKATNRIYFREVIFKNEIPAGKSWRDDFGGLSAKEIEFENKQIVITKANPAKCMQCHEMPGQNGWARYIWSPYPLWPRTYGEQDDRLANDEIDSLKQFRQTRNERYELLHAPRDKYPFHDGGEIKLAARPNLLLTKFIGVYQAAQIAKLILGTASSEERKDIQQEKLEHMPGFETQVMKIMKRLNLNPDRILAAPSDPSPPFGLGSRTLFGGYNIDSLIEQQAFQMVVGDKTFRRLIDLLPQRKRDPYFYPEPPPSYYEDLDPETREILNDHFQFKSIWWVIDQATRRKIFEKAAR